MSDGLSNLGGSVMGNGEEIPLIHMLSPAKVATERALSAYRQNIATADLYIADRRKTYAPVILGEDGQELTPEKRKQLMEEAGVKPMFDENGEPTEQQYADPESGTSVFDQALETERFGKSAEQLRDEQGTRLIRPRELELHADVSQDTVVSAQGGTYVPGAEGSEMAPIDENCVYSSTSFAEVVYDGQSLLTHLGRALAALYRASGKHKSGAKFAMMSEQVHSLLKTNFVKYESLRATNASFAGCLVRHQELDTAIRLYGDPAYVGQLYAEIYIDPRAFSQWLADPQADTDTLPAVELPEEIEPEEEGDG